MIKTKKGIKLLEEIKRKGARLIVGTILILIAFYLKNTYDIELARNVLFFLLLFSILMDWLRVDMKQFVFVHDLLLKRPTERIGLHGSTLGGIGCLLAVTFFDFDIALAAIAMYLYGDAFAGIMGMAFGKIKIFKDKSLQGSAAMFVVSALVGYIFIDNIFLVLGMAAFATFLEMILARIPDDLLLPVFTALVGQFLSFRPLKKGFTIALITWLILIAALIIFPGLWSLYKKLQKR